MYRVYYKVDSKIKEKELFGQMALSDFLGKNKIVGVVCIA
jgi:hypothetical protein